MGNGAVELRTDESAGPASGAPASNRAALRVFTALAVMFCSGVVAQVFLAGLGLLVDASYLAWHSTFVHLLEGLLLLMVVVGLLARAGGRALALTVGLYVLIAAQYAFIHGLEGPFRALHAVNALALFVVGWQVAKAAAHRGWSIVDGEGHHRSARLDALLGSAVLLVAVASIAVAGTMSSGADPVAESSGTLGSITNSAVGSRAAGSQEARRSEPAGAGAVANALGEQVYAENCSGCHGGRGQGRVGPALAGNDALADREFVVERVSEGGGIMPPFAGSLSAAQIAAVVDHVRASWGNGF